MVDTIVKYLREASANYYLNGDSKITDEVYDALLRTLRKLDPNNPYLREVGSPVTENSSKVGRIVPMGTLSKYHKYEEVLKWLENLPCNEVLVSPKYDGFGVELVYQNGYLFMASTRGDGNVGEDVLEAVLRISSVPVRINHEGFLRVRGEVIIPRKNHEKVLSLGYSAMRNAVPGIVRSNRKEALIYVDFVAYEFFDGSEDRKSQRDHYEGVFITEDYTLHSKNDFEGIQNTREYFSKCKDSYDYEIDGIVLKSRNIMEDDLFCPSYQIAWKWKSNRETTILRKINFEVGPTGVISVVGEFDPVEFQGATLTRASIGSLQRYTEMKPTIRSLVEVSRRGDIIPYIEDVSIFSDEEFLSVDTCPCCGYPLVNFKCENKECPDRLKKKIIQYVKYLGVRGIGSSLVESLIDNHYITSIPDIYTINPECILNLPRQGKSSVEKWKTLQQKSITSLEILCAYPFDNIGKSTWISMLERWTLPEIINLSEKDLEGVKIKGLGSGKVSNLLNQLEESRAELLDIVNLLIRI